MRVWELMKASWLIKMTGEKESREYTLVEKFKYDKIRKYTCGGKCELNGSL